MRSVAPSMSPSASDDEVSIKLFLHRSNGSVAKHRVRGQFDWEAMTSFIATAWAGCHVGKPLLVEYVDEEGDTVCVSSAVEWTECLRVYREFTSKGERPLCLNVRRRAHTDMDEWSDDERDQATEPSSTTRLHFRDPQASVTTRDINAPPSYTVLRAHFPPPPPPPAAYTATTAAPPMEDEEFVQVDVPSDVTTEVVAPTVPEEPAPPVHVDTPRPSCEAVPLPPLSARSEATTKLRAIFPDLAEDEARLLMHIHGNNLQTAVAYKLGS